MYMDKIGELMDYPILPAVKYLWTITYECYKHMIIHREPILIHSQSTTALINGRAPTPFSVLTDSPVPIKNRVSVRLFRAAGTIHSVYAELEGMNVFNSIAPMKRKIK